MATKTKTRQQIFNKVWQEFVVKGRPRSINDNNQCVYRMIDGDGIVRQCGVGVLIPKKDYSEEIEGAGVGEYTVYDRYNQGKATVALRTTLEKALGIPDLTHGDSYPTISLLKSIQSLHDGFSSCDGETGEDWIRYMREGLTRIAVDKSLKVPK